MNPRFLLSSIILIWIIISSASAQTSYSIHGAIIDSISQKPLDYVTVGLKKANGAFLKSTLTKEDGGFMLEKLGAGKYALSINTIGYKSKIIFVELKDSLKRIAVLGNVPLSSQNKELKEVKILGNRPVVTQEIDRLVYDVQADPANKGLNILEVMQKVPLVSIDGEDNIQLKGSSDFKIYVNGRPSGVMASNPAQALRIMRSPTVKKIEVITTPSAKYDSEGVAGIINIITSSNVEGYNVIFEVFHTSRLGAYGVGSAFTAKKGGFGIAGYAGRFTRANVPISTFENSRTTYSVNQSVINSGNTKIYGSHTPINADLSYEIDSLNLLTSSIVFTLNSFNQNDSQTFNTYNQQESLVNSYSFNTTGKPLSGGVDIALNYQLGFKNKKDRFLTTSYRYSTTTNELESKNTAIGILNYQDNQLFQKNDAGMKENTLQVDYVKPGKKINTEAGAKLIMRDSHSDFITEKISANNIETTSDNFDYGQNIYSLYNAYQLKVKNWGIYTGLRLERTIIDANFITSGKALNKSYNNLIPSIIIQRKLQNSRSINLGYTQRIQRPGILQLNPFENQINPLYYTSGNPDLTAVLNNTFDLNYSILKKTTINISLNYSFANNTIQNVVTLGNDGITRSSFANIGKNDNLGTSLSIINYPITKSLKYNLNARGQYLWLSGTVGGKGYNSEGFVFSTSNNISYTTPHDWRLKLLLTTTTPVMSLQGETNGYVYSVVTLNKEFFNKKLGVIFRIDNPTEKYRTIINRFNTSDFSQENQSMKIARGFYLNIYYTIGELKDKIKKNKRGVENNDIEKGKNEFN